MNPVSVVIMTIGTILMYASVTNTDPRDVVLKSLGQKAKYGPIMEDQLPAGTFKRFSSTDSDNPIPPGTVWTSV